MNEELYCTVDGGIASVVLNRPERRNALSGDVIRGLRRIFTELEQNRDVRAVVVRGTGPVFCAGLDLKEMRARDGERDPDANLSDVLHQIETSRHPTIAMIQGDALAGGCELALHCDLRVVAEHARFGMPLAKVGLMVPYDLGRKLVEVIGPAHTLHLLLTAQPVGAPRAYEIGMVHQVVPAPELEAAVGALAETIAANAPLSLAGMKQVVRRAASANSALAHEDLDRLVQQARRSSDAREGVAAQLERRRPVFKGE